MRNNCIYTKNRLLLVACSLAFLISAAPASAFPLFKKKKKKTEQPAPVSDYKKITGRDSVAWNGVMNVVMKGDTVYLEIPAAVLGRAFLVTNRLQKVPQELNESGVNKGVNYESQVVSFQWDKARKKVDIRQQRNTPEVNSGDDIAASIGENYLNPMLCSLKVEAVSSDSSSVVVKVNDLFNGRNNCLNDVFNEINIGTSPKTDLSRIISVKAFKNSVTALSDLTTTVTEGNNKVNVTVEVSTSLTLLPEQPMAGREENQRIGYFTTSRLQYADSQQRVKKKNYVTRWRVEPKDTAAYLSGQLTEPVKPILIYIDKAVPSHLRPYIKQGILAWNEAFERAGFKNVVSVEDYPDSLAQEGDDMACSVLTYVASEKANAMGPSTIDPRTGEIIEADIIWWHNVQSLITEWLTVQTGSYNPAVRALQLPDSIIGEAVRFVACHEMGHSLGLRHNMIASAAYPTDSLRSASFVGRMGNLSASIMDYARFNYVAQPCDNITLISPHIGPYDLLAIEWGYRWYPDEKQAQTALHELLRRHQGPLYRYSEAQSSRTAIDPRALSEDLGDDAVKSAKYGIANLKRVMPNIIDWTRNGEPDQTYDEAARLYSAVIFQWGLYLYHALANVGGMYIENTTVGDGQTTFAFVEKEKQQKAVKFLLDEVFCYPRWLFDTPLSQYTYIHRKTPNGIQEVNPSVMLKNQQNYMFWDLLSNERLLRMLENEMHNGQKAFTTVDLIDMLHRHIFATTLAGKSPDVMERSLQKSYVDALMTAAAESEGVKIEKTLSGLDCLTRDLSTGSRIIETGNRQIRRTSDAISVKRGELMRIMKLLKSRRGSASRAAQLHYEDVILRIQTALGLTKN
ncbi:MAG: zinc-dependent metalloprotease [Prevotella sp.]|nr:zinc-dependent metalloprotease [Prevotella sp.]